ncbi:MAG: sensor histidine kinase, partial [Vicinamibacteraceae bacterium]
VGLFTQTVPDRGSHSARRIRMIRVGDNAKTNRVNVLYRNRAGRIWAGTDEGLFWLDETRSFPVFQRLKVPSELGGHDLQVWTMLEDARGSFWIGTSVGLIRLRADGRVERHTIRPVHLVDHVWALMEDADERLWIGHQRGLLVVKPRVATSPTVDAGFDRLHAYSTRDGLAADVVYALQQSKDGRIWIGTEAGLSTFDQDRLRTYNSEQGISASAVTAISEDAGGNIWIGRADGAIRVAGNGLVTYDEQDGLGGTLVYRILESGAGELCVATQNQTLNVFDGTRFRSIRLKLPADGTERSSRTVVLHDHRGEWWLAIGGTLYRYPRTKTVADLATTIPTSAYTTRDGLAPGDIRTLFEDSRGDIWIGARVTGREVVTRWNRATSMFHRYSDQHGLQPYATAGSFAEDHAGNVWIAFWGEGVARYRRGRFEWFATHDDGTSLEPDASSGAIYVDRSGRLWVGTNNAVLRVDQPNADRVHFEPLTTVQRLSGIGRVFVEDDQRRLYVGTMDGVDRLDPTTHDVTHYSRSDGLAQMLTTAAFRDARGDIWFGTYNGLSRLTPRREPVHQTPPALIGGVRIDGIAETIDDLGQAEVADLRLHATHRSLEIDFLALVFHTPNQLQFQYRLNGIDEHWHPPTDQRRVTYGHLAPGTYEFQVRTVSRGRRDAGSAARVAFLVSPPIWARSWFLLLCTLSVGALAVVIHRYRVSRLLELERVRVRIATDLHDDIGSNLSKIALLSGMTSQQVAASSPELATCLASIADVSQESVDSMSDIVWAVDPTKDRLHDLVLRMRRFASDVFTARDIDLHFTAPVEDEGPVLGADIRREVFLIFKEAVNNVVRHAACTTAEVTLTVDAACLALVVRDDGRGFILEEQAGQGNGLASMERRAHALGGKFAISSSPYDGTCVKLMISIRRRRLGDPPRGRIDEKLDVPGQTKPAVTAWLRRRLQ